MNTTEVPEKKSKKDMVCFVVIGFGMKTDFATGRVLNLDKTYTELIKPAFDRVGVKCFRAIDVNRSGSIDEIMYQWLYNADIVVADLSTMNANVFYELGVRHAQKPNTTLLMAEDQIFSRIPFDLGHMVIQPYKHLGEEISEATKTTFVEEFSAKVQNLIDSPIDRDSPVYTYMRGMEPPKYIDFETRMAELQAELDEQAGDGGPPSLGPMVEMAERAKDEKDFPTAIKLFGDCVEADEKDTFLHQRWALVTYKEKESVEDYPDAEALEAFLAAETILEVLEPDISTDPETLGLAGAINKRRFERTRKIEDLERSIHYYERGFYVKQDYYNGINVAFLYNLKANLIEDYYEALFAYGHARMVRRKVAEVCNGLIRQENFNERGDKEWVYQTLAQAYLGMDQEDEAERLMPKISALSKGDFDMDTFKKQNNDLIQALADFHKRVSELASGERPAAPGSPGGEVAISQASSNGGATVARDSNSESIVLDVGRNAGKSIRSIDVHYKIEYT